MISYLISNFKVIALTLSNKLAFPLSEKCDTMNNN